MKRLLLFAALSFSLGGLLSAQTTIINPAGDGGFETGTSFALNNWTVVNGAGPTVQTNKWFCGNVPVGFTGARCAYISDNNTGATHNYNVNALSVAHIYRNFTVPAAQSFVTLSFSYKNVGEVGWDYLQVFVVPTTTTPVEGTQLFSGQIGTNYAGQAAWTNVNISLPCNLAGTTQRLVFSWRNDGIIGTQPPVAIDNISLVSNSTGPTCAALLGTGVINVAALPYTTSGTTCGAVDDLTSANTVVCGSTSYLTGEDQVFVFTPTSSGNITVSLTSTGSYTGLMLYSGCPASSGCSSAGTCIASAQDWLGSKSLCAPVISGTTYYLVLDSWASPTCNPYSNLTISAPVGTPAGTVCGNAPAITLPYNATGQTTACYGNDYSNASTGSCLSLYESGEDHVYKLTVASAQCIGVTLSNASSTSIGFQVYSGCPGSAGTTCVGSYGGSNPLAGSIVLPAAGTYYIVVDSWANPFNVNYDISVVSYGSGPANDLPCNAISLTLNAAMAGDNNCSGGAGEPAVPACWWNGNVNTIWYKVVCPASGSLKVVTALGTLTDTQIALWTGTCGTLTLVANGCNDNAPQCSGTVYYSTVSVSGLTPGSTYYVSVDGYMNLTGTFTITAMDGLNMVPTNQDCSGAINVCSTFITQANSYFGCGNVQDVPPSGSIPGNPSTNPNCCNSGCMLSGELNTVWYSITISSNGNLAWTVNKPGGGYYDWNLYPRTTNTCADIANNLVAPIRCNWNCTSIGATGMQTAANVPAGSSACNFETPLAVTAGQTYELALSNYSYTNGGITLDFGNSTCGIAVPTSITWTGNTSNVWGLAANWGGCNPPACGIDAVVVSSLNPPVISVNSSVRSLTIQPGGSLTINPGVTLTICGDLNVFGTLIASPTSTILFNNGAVVQNITGTLTGANAVGNLTVTKTGGSVILANDIDIAGTFTTSSATSIFNTTGKYIKVGGNFVNATGNTTFANTGATGTLEFFGAAAQTYNQGTTQLDLNFVKMNHTGTGVTLQTNMVMKAVTGALNLTLGKIITGANEVRVYNTTPACVSTGNVSSYVEGFLRRWTLTGSYDFPVGEAVKGYERANVNFTANTNVNNLRANFVQYGSIPAALNVTDCAIFYNMPALDDGKWIINAYDAALTQITGTCTYDMVLYNRVGSYTNATGNLAWTIMKDPTGTGAWALTGVCNGASTLNATMRNGMSGFSHFGTAQSSSPLPVEFLMFAGENLGEKNRLVWKTASETNNDYFTLERSVDGLSFSEVTRVHGSGTSTQQHSYEAFDYYPNSGYNYYRLKQTDYNGATSYSGIVVMENKFVIASVENVHPNPTTGDLNFDLLSTEKGTILVEVMDITGRVVLSTSSSVEDGRNTLKVDISSLAQGTYMLHVSMGCCSFSSINKVIRE